MEPIFDVPLVLAIAPLVGAALIGAAGSIAGGLIGSSGQSSANQVNREIAREQMEFQREANQLQMDFQERMSNTSHQREVADLRAAGLNPILSAGGSGASSPAGTSSSGASIAMQNPNADIARGVEKAANSAVTYIQNKKALDLMNAQIDKTKAEAANSALLNEVQLGKWKDGPLADRINAEAATARSVQRLSELAEVGAKNSAQFEKEVGSDMKYLRPVLETLKTLKK